MWAPRATARSYSSSTRTAPPSPMTKPSRLASNGIETPLVDNAVILANPASPIGVIAASEDPARTTSHRPVATRRAPAPTLWVPAAHAVTMDSHGPHNPYRIEMSAAARLPIIMGTRKGVTRRAPFSIRTWIDRKSTRLNSSHSQISYAVFCLKKKKKKTKKIKNKEKKDSKKHQYKRYELHIN